MKPLSAFVVVASCMSAASAWPHVRRIRVNVISLDAPRAVRGQREGYKVRDRVRFMVGAFSSLLPQRRNIIL
jgi:hypothetical protein